MEAVQTPLKNEQTEDVCECMELLKTLDREEKLQIKGVMMGLQMAKKVANAEGA